MIEVILVVLLATNLIILFLIWNKKAGRKYKPKGSNNSVCKFKPKLPLKENFVGWLKEKEGLNKISFNKEKDEIARTIFGVLNRDCFGNRIPKDINISWSNRLKRAAGKARRKNLSIDLSNSLVTSVEKLASVMSHEVCHIANYHIDKANCGHGSDFKKWGEKIEKIFGDYIKVTTYFEYKVDYKYIYKCPKCGHTKRLFVNRKVKNCKCGTEYKKNLII